MKRSFTVVGHRFFSRQPLAEHQRVLLDEEEARHLVTVMRARAGDEIILFDGSGAEFPARVYQVQRSKVEVEVLARQEIDRELPVTLQLAVPLPRGDRQRWLVEKAVELGVARIVPLITARSVVQPQPEPPQRLQRAVIEACKQCGRNRLLEIDTPHSVEQLVARAAPCDIRWWAHPAHRGETHLPHAPPWSRSPLPRGSSAMIAVGPEGGFTEAEVQTAREHGWQLVDLGNRILRIETAALALVAQLAMLAETS